MFKKPLINRQIRAREVRLIDENGKQLGVVSFEEAARLAIERKLDLIQVTEKLEPPVCRLGDYGKYLYREKKKEKTTHKHKGGELKGIRLTFNISRHDLETRVRQAEKFLKRGDRVRVNLPLKGRQKALQDFAREKVETFLEILKASLPIKIERELKREPRGFSMIITKQ
ncbi:MAG TPA: translation initiation factor IF-3 [Patescibacteria group bacterium]|nr:translation initiation factor IF-3 [Patescibacteria group bacterium]